MITELADYLTPTEDDRLEQAEALVRGFCGWHIAPSREDTVTLRGMESGVLMLPSLYVTEVTSVTTDSVPQVADVDYYEFQAGYLLRLSGWWSTRQVVVVEFTHGYAVPPPEVTAVVQAIAQRATNNPGGVPSSRAIGPFSESYGSFANGTALSLFESEKEVLRRYRLPVVA